MQRAWTRTLHWLGSATGTVFPPGRRRGGRYGCHVLMAGRETDKFVPRGESARAEAVVLLYISYYDKMY